MRRMILVLFFFYIITFSLNGITNAAINEGNDKKTNNPIKSVGLFGNNLIGIGFSGENEWKEQNKERRSFVLNLGVKNKTSSPGYEYSCGLNYLFHRDYCEDAFFGSYTGVAITVVNNTGYLGIPLGVKAFLKEALNAYIEAMPVISDAKSYISYGFGVRMNTIFAMPAYSPTF